MSAEVPCTSLWIFFDRHSENKAATDKTTTHTIQYSIVAIVLTSLSNTDKVLISTLGFILKHNARDLSILPQYKLLTNNYFYTLVIRYIFFYVRNYVM